MSKQKLAIFISAFVLIASGCTWQQTLAWDEANGWNPGTTNHLLVTNFGPEANTHPDAVAARDTIDKSDVWWRLAGCETGYKYDNPNTGNGYFGFFQFSLSTWKGVGGPGYPHQHSYNTQKHYAQKLQARNGWSPWPACSRKLGLR